jgi:hypothetical protein
MKSDQIMEGWCASSSECAASLLFRERCVVGGGGVLYGGKVVQALDYGVGSMCGSFICRLS